MLKNGRRDAPINPDAPTFAQHENKVDEKDPHDIYSRFVTNHVHNFTKALEVIEKGRKRSCWIWFILPAAPYIVGGVENGSSMTKRFALRGDETARAYLRFPPHDLLEGILTTVTVDLHNNYLTLAKAVLSQVESGIHWRLSLVFGMSPRSRVH